MANKEERQNDTQNAYLAAQKKLDRNLKKDIRKAKKHLKRSYIEESDIAYDKYQAALAAIDKETV